ncbi:uncharacterized protein si:ch211-199g17.2 isoform X2 [Colossoma macropomum]|nr:uncharacterized protein si:ch211-199g17.2 isoform X2 [Colossoma macropomum]
MELAKVVEKKEGTGNVQVLHLDDVIYKEMISKPALDAVAQVKKIKIQTRISGLQSSIFNKHTKCERSTAALSPAWTSTSWSSKLRQSRNVSSANAPCLTRSCSQGRMLPEKEAQSPVRCWMPAEILHPDGDTTVQSPVRTIIPARTPPGFTVSSEFASPTRPISPTRAFSSGTAPRPLKRWSPVKASEHNAFMHADKADDVSGVIDTDRSFGTDLYLSNTEQTAKRKHEAQCQNSSLTMTINQKTNQENISCQKISQGVNGTLSPVIPQDQDQCQDDPKVQEPFKTVWSLKDSNGEQEELQQTRPLGFEHLSRNSVMLSQHELKDHSQTCSAKSPMLSEESPESYRGAQPLIGLQAVIKCQSVDGDPPPCCYLCRPCSLKVLKSDIIHHLISPQHQLNYINFHHPHLLLDMDGDLSLQTVAMQLEQEEGRGQMKVTRLSACLLSEILEKDFDWCIKMLNCGSTAEIKPEQSPLMAGSSMSSGCSITLKRPYESAGITVDHNRDRTLHDHTGKVPLRQWSSSRRAVSLKKARRKEPVFKVSLSLSAGPVIVDRMSPVSTTVAPEIECQNPETEYTENDAFSEDITSGNHMLTLEHKNLEQNPKTFQNVQLYPTECLYTEENSQSLRYTNAETDTSTYGYMNTRQFPDSVEYTGTVFTGSLNSSQGPESSHRHLHHNSVVEDVSGSSTSNNCPADGLSSTCNGNVRIMERQEVRSNACDWLIEKDPVTQHANNWPKENPMFVQSDATQMMLAKQVPQQMFGERNCDVMNVPMYMHPAIIGAYVPAINTYTSYPVQYVNQRWMWGSTLLTGLSNQHNV